MNAPLEDLDRRGWAVLDASSNLETGSAMLESLMSSAFVPLHVFGRFPFWKPIGVDPSRPAGRSGGAGHNSLHIDCVNMSRPPDLVVLFCVQPDPNGGGASLVGAAEQAAEALSARSRAALSRPVFRDGTAYDLQGVGEPLNSFAVLTGAGDPFVCRYTGRLLEQDHDLEDLRALTEFDRTLAHATTAIALEAGQGLVVDQRRCLHGRLPLHGDQSQVPEADRRLLVQAFFSRRKPAALTG